MAHGTDFSRLQLSDEEIARRAYRKWQLRGCPVGNPQEDWLAARAELMRELAFRSYDEEIACFD